VLKILNRITASLTGKLVTVLGLVILLGGSAFWYISIQTDRRNLMDNTVSFASSFSEMVKRSIRYDMLTFQMEGIQSTLESIGASKSVKRTRLFDGMGRVAYSSDRSEVGHTVDTGSASCSGCHEGGLPTVTLVRERQWTIYDEKPGQRVLSFVEPIYNEPDCFTAACHVHHEGQKVLGVLATDFPLSHIDTSIRKQMMSSSVYLLSFLAVSALLLSLVLWRFVLRPVKTLSRGMERVSSGDLSQKVSVPSKDEIGRLALNFNDMTGELSVARKRVERWTQSLSEEVEKKAAEIKRTQGKLVEAEKLAALGRITADIAHEIRNPLTALGGFGRRLRRLAVSEKEKEYSDIMVSEVDRLEHILRDVLTFSREAKMKFQRQPVTWAVKESVATFQGVCEDNGVDIVTDLSTDLPVLIDAEQARQAINNLISNAVDAMPGGGTLRVTTAAEEANNITYVAVHVSDTGPGIPEDKLSLIFEPFHTSKVIGQGTGLGLSISRKIMEEHGGFIKAENGESGGAVVSLYFPYESEEELSKVPCWEFMKCGRNSGDGVRCPAYPHFGRVCWVVAGTFCEGKVQGTFAQKCEDCTECEFFKEATGGRRPAAV
jgi:two-component system NtrC family sensor kinase